MLFFPSSLIVFLHSFSFSSFSSLPSLPSLSLCCPLFLLYLTGILQKESKFPRMVCRPNRDLHGLVTALKPTKTTKTLIADGQPVTSHGPDCEVHYHLSRTTLSKSCWFDLLASISPTVLQFYLIHSLPWFHICLRLIHVYLSLLTDGCSVALKQHTYLLFIYVSFLLY